MRLRVGILFVVVFAALAAAPAANAVITGHQEPSWTKGTSNTWWWNETISSGSGREQYCFDLYENNTYLQELGCTAGWFSSPSNSNFPVTVNGLTPGKQYFLLVDRYIEGIGLAPQGSYGLVNRTTVMDTGKPTATVWVNETDQFTTNPLIRIHIEYLDALSVPWANNWVCVASGGTCAPTVYQPNCSSPYRLGFPQQYFGFDCTWDVSSAPDGPIYSCAYVADQAIPDNPSGINQFVATGDQANLSDTACGNVTLDRAAPSLSISASDPQPVTGSLVTFTANVSDATSGVNPAAITWDLNNDGVAEPGKTGPSVTYTYTTPATFDVTARVSDNAGNAGSATVRIGVHAPGQPPPSYTPPPALPGSGGAAVPGACTIYGTIGNDVIKGTAGKDIICGQTGNDKISGLGGNDILRGGPGNDTLIGGPGNDVMNGEAGKDKLLAKNAGNDKLNGGKGRDSGSWNKKDTAKGMERRIA